MARDIAEALSKSKSPEEIQRIVKSFQPDNPGVQQELRAWTRDMLEFRDESGNNPMLKAFQDILNNPEFISSLQPLIESMMRGENPALLDLVKQFPMTPKKKDQKEQ